MHGETIKSVIHCTGRCVTPTDGLDRLVKKKNKLNFVNNIFNIL